MKLPKKRQFIYFSFLKIKISSLTTQKMLLFAFPDLTSPEVLFGLLTLTFLEIVLGVDNIIFISIISSRLPEKDQPKARQIGLLLAMALRIMLLFGISWVIGLTAPLFEVNFLGMHGSVTGQGIILLLGGIFLLYKATSEIHHKLEAPDEDDDPNKNKNSMFKGLSGAVIQIGLINIVFSFDSILTAIGMSKDIFVMMAAVIISIFIMNASSGSCINSDMIDSNKHVRAKTVSPPKVKKDTHVSKPKVTPEKAKTKDTRKVNAPTEHVKVVPIVTPVKISKPLGPKQVWVPKKK